MVGQDPPYKIGIWYVKKTLSHLYAIFNRLRLAF